jgi:hypothetical protein
MWRKARRSERDRRRGRRRGRGSGRSEEFIQCASCIVYIHADYILCGE